MITKRRIAAKMPYAPYVMRLILSCVVLDDKRLRAGDEMALKISDYAGLLVFARLCSVFYGGWFAVRLCFETLKATSKSNISPSLRILRFWRFRSRFMLPKYMVGWRTEQLRRLN